MSMKKIINNLLYDTEKSMLVYDDTSAKFPRKYYKSPKGTYFMLIVQKGDIQIVDEKIIKDLLAEHDEFEMYIQCFGDIEEG